MIRYDGLPYISVAISEYDPSEVERLKSCIKSILTQDYQGDFEIILVSESEEVSSHIENEFGDEDRLRIVALENEDGGLSAARNEAVEHAEGDVIAYIDSDARAKENWLSNLGKAYRENNVLAIGGKATPKWNSPRPPYLPDEFLWLVGCTYTGHPENGSTLRNGIGCNMSYKKTVLDEIKFSDNLGKNHGYNLQGEEPELGIRMQKKFNAGVYYLEDADIEHDVDKVQTEFGWLSKRAYLQGISKSIIKSNTGDESLTTDKSYLGMIIRETIPKYLKGSVTGPRTQSLFYLVGTLYFTFLVGVGYLVGSMKLALGLIE